MKVWIKYLVIAILLTAIGALTYGYKKFGHLITTGTGLVAHQVCSCLYVSNRKLQACLDDRWPDTRNIMATPIEIDGAQGVEATSFVITRTAVFEPEFGCTLQN